MTRNSLRLKFLNDSRVAGFNDLSELAAGSDLSELSELSSCQWQEEEAMDCGVRALVDLGGSWWILVTWGCVDGGIYGNSMGKWGYNGDE